MTRNKEELDALKNEVEAINSKLQRLDDEELKYVAGGTNIFPEMNPNTDIGPLWFDMNKNVEPDVMWSDSLRPQDNPTTPNGDNPTIYL